MLIKSIGNRSEAIEGTDPVTVYQTNNLNQYTQVTGPDPTQDVFHDEDGNLTSLVTGTTTTQYAWNAENRLIAVGPQSPTDGAIKAEFTYDYIGRRVEKSVSTWSSGSWTETSSTLFLYDGWNLIKETTTENNTTTTRHFIWGLDLSQTPQGAGGIGGLIATVTDSGTFLHTCDANGNTAQLINPTTSTIAAHYEYDPFGNLLLATGPHAANNPFRFSTKYTDDETGLVYYGYRYYSPELGRWINRDPLSIDLDLQSESNNRELLGPWSNLIAETGEMWLINLLSFIGNNPTTMIDILGLWGSDLHKHATMDWVRETTALKDGKLLRFRDQDPELIGIACDMVDWNWHPWNRSNRPIHFNHPLYSVPDTRDGWWDRFFEAALNYVNHAKSKDSALCDMAIRSLGTGLHAIQDKHSHNKKHKAESYEAHAKTSAPVKASFGLLGTDPDSMRTWPEDVEAAYQETRMKLREYLLAIDCNVCIER